MAGKRRNMRVSELREEVLPRHVAVIMDGNGRWAQKRGLPRIEGHRRGRDSVRAVVETAYDLGIPYLTLFAFSTENWRRPKSEISALMGFLKRYLRTELKKMMKRGIRLVAIGNLARLPRDVRAELNRVVSATRTNRRMTVVLAISYGGREEITQAVRQIARRVEQGEIKAADVDEDLVGAHLGTAELPDPDLLIRTSGEMRVSNFLLWQIAYCEIYVTERLWPDFREHDFIEALRHFARRERRFGRVSDQLERERAGAAR